MEKILKFYLHSNEQAVRMTAMNEGRPRQSQHSFRRSALDGSSAEALDGTGDPWSGTGSADQRQGSAENGMVGRGDGKIFRFLSAVATRKPIV